MLDAKAIIADACAQTGLSDFGPAPAVEAPFGVLVDALNREARLSEQGIQARRLGLTRVLANRLRIENTIRRKPGILAEPIAGPIVIVGLARSGTTKLHRMIAAGQGLQSLPLWKMMSPVGDEAASSSAASSAAADDARIAFAQQAAAAMRTRHPRFHAAHPMEALEPDEEVFLMEMTFLGNLHVHGNHVPSYHDWLERQSYDAWYACLRRLLQFFQWQGGSARTPWLLKAPFHLGHLPLLFRHFPGATIVHCHREPVATIASLCGLVEASRSMHCDTVSAREVGATVMRIWPALMRQYLADRAGMEQSHRFIDLPYRRIVSDAMACIDEVYQAAGMSLSQHAREQMLDWESANAQHKHGRHDYVLQDYGLTPQDVSQGFAAYSERFADYL